MMTSDAEETAQAALYRGYLVLPKETDARTDPAARLYEAMCEVDARPVVMLFRGAEYARLHVDWLYWDRFMYGGGRNRHGRDQLLAPARAVVAHYATGLTGGWWTVDRIPLNRADALMRELVAALPASNPEAGAA